MAELIEQIEQAYQRMQAAIEKASMISNVEQKKQSITVAVDQGQAEINRLSNQLSTEKLQQQKAKPSIGPSLAQDLEKPAKDWGVWALMGAVVMGGVAAHNQHIKKNGGK